MTLPRDDCDSGYGDYVVIEATDGTCQFVAGLDNYVPKAETEVEPDTGLGSFNLLHVDHVDCQSGANLPWAPVGVLRQPLYARMIVPEIPATAVIGLPEKDATSMA